MGISEKTSRILTALLAAGMVLLAALLPACSSGTADPADTSAEESSDIPATGTPFRSLSDEEAEALFGHSEPGAMSHTDDGWHYFLGYLNDNGLSCTTMYRYHYGTGEVEYVCKDPGCSHRGDGSGLSSDCPLYIPASLDFGGSNIAVTNGKVICLGRDLYAHDEEGNILFDEYGFTVKEAEALVWYDPQTAESRVYPVGYPGQCWNCYRAGGSFYYEKMQTVVETGSLRCELWRVDEMGSEPVLAVSVEEDVYGIIPYLFGEEVVFVAYSYVSPEGETDYSHFWLYRIDEETGERSLLLEKPLPEPSIKVSGNLILYEEFDTTWWQTHNEDTDPPAPRTLRLADLSTGEDKIIAENTEYIYKTALTDRCVFYLQDDPSEEFAYILHCYDYLTNEKKEYPLKGDKWLDGGFYYDRGQVYSIRPGLQNKQGQFYTWADLVVWDIASGAQRVISGGSVVKEIK